jgi:leader peptidase (prepilin peptidase)/N-methyltransferase
MTQTAATVALFPAGLLFGSFATVVAHRVPRGEGFVTGRSRCPSCGSQIAAYDNVPVLSWVLLRGSCRNCGTRISAAYPLAELAMAVLFATTALVLGTGDAAALAMALVFCAVLVVVTLTDLEQRVIPNAILAAGALAGLALAAVGDPASLPERLGCAVGGGALLLLAALAYPRGMGMGDVKLVATMGIFLGINVAPALLVAFGAGAAAGLVLIAREGAAARKRKVPFGPFLALGGLVGIWAGPELVHWYATTFLGA